MSQDSTRQLSLRLRAAPVRGAVRISVEGDLLDPSLLGWDRVFQRRVRGPLGLLRGRSRDRLHAEGEAFFEETLKPRLLYAGVERVHAARKAGQLVILESDGVDHVVRPLARHLQADRYVARRFEFREGIATGRTLPDAPEIDTHPADTPPGSVVLLGRAGPPAPLDVRSALAGRGILAVGATGFLGKVWLAGLLENVPDLGRVVLLARRRRGRSPEERVARMFRESPVFESLRRRHGARFPEFLDRKIEVLEGDIRRCDLALEPGVRERLAGRVHLIVNCAGLTEFNPDPRDALAINADGVAHLLDLAREAGDAALLHVSTCFVAGRREGRIPEQIDPFRTPAGTPDFHPEQEIARLRSLIERHAGGTRTNGGAARSVRRGLIEAVLERARELGWPNIYTFTKALGEGLVGLAWRSDPGRPVSVVRPSIVETAVEFPFRGWNEGVNTSAPLSHLLGTYFRQLPVNQRKRLDVLPVDLLARGLTLVAAALVEGRAEHVVQLATSAVNPLDLRRAVELTSLAHRKHHRSRTGWRSRILARLDAVPVSRERYGRMSVPAQLRVVRGINRVLGAVTGGRPPLARAERTLARVKELVDLYEPFLLDNEPVFEADHIEMLAAAVPPEDRDRFGYDPRRLEWYEYWIDVHIPGLRRWSYPLIEGRPIEAEVPAGPVPIRGVRAPSPPEPPDVPAELAARSGRES